MKPRLFHFLVLTALLAHLGCGCTNRAARTQPEAAAPSAKPGNSSAVHTRPIQPADSAALPEGDATANSNAGDESAPSGPDSIRSASTCGGAATRRIIAHLAWKNKTFSDGLCGEPPCTEADLTNRLIYYDDVLRDDPRVEACQVFDKTAMHAGSALFIIDGTRVEELMIYDGYSLGSDPDHRSHGYKDLIGLQKTGVWDWLEERFVWDGRGYKLKRTRRLKSDELK